MRKYFGEHAWLNFPDGIDAFLADAEEGGAAEVAEVPRRDAA